MVQSMGLILVAGTILLVYFAFQKMQQKSDETSVNRDVPRKWRTCEDHTLPLAENETIERIEFDEDGLTRLILRSPGDKWQIVWVHGCSGEVVGRLRIGTPQ